MPAARIQPQGRARVNKAHPLARGLLGFWLPQGGGFVSAVSGATKAAITANGGLSSGRAGRALRANSSGVTASIPQTASIQPANAMTVLTAGIRASSGQFGCENSNDGWGAWAADHVYLRVGGAWADQTHSVPAGSYGQIGFTYDGATFYAIGNGARANSQAISGTITHSTVDIALNATNVSGSNGSTAGSTFDYFAIWGRALSPSELASFYANPWQLFEGQPAMLSPAAAPAGGATASPLGVSASSAVGSATVTGQASTSPAGVAATAAVGTATASGSTVINGTASPAGVSAASAVGTAIATGAASSTAQPAGVSSVASVGAAVASGQGKALPSGVGVSASVGTALASGTAITTAYPAGVQAVASVGIAAVSGLATAAPLGVASSIIVGTAYAHGPVVVPPPQEYFRGAINGAPVCLRGNAMSDSPLYYRGRVDGSDVYFRSPLLENNVYASGYIG